MCLLPLPIIAHARTHHANRTRIPSAAVGAEFPKDLTNLEGSDAYGDIEGMRLASFSFPTEVREYQTFDTDEFKEMK